MEAITFEQLPTAFTQLFNKVENIETLLKLSAEDLSPEEDFFTIQQTAEFIKLSVNTVYSLVSKNELPFCKKGKRLYFSKQELISWIRAGRNKTNSEMKLKEEVMHG